MKGCVSLTWLLSVIFVSRVNSALVQRSELLEQERERRERRRHLEALGTLAAGAAHELGTPLSTIAIIAKELERRLEREGANEEDLADARLIRDEVARCRRILGRMSTEAGDGPGEEIVGTSLPDFGRQILGEMAGASAVVLTVEGGDDPVDLPREGLATSVRALVQNALDASPPGVKVDLRLVRTDEALTISVIDEGEGMDPQSPVASLQTSNVQGFSSSHKESGPGVQTPLLHVSPTVQISPSSHGAVTGEKIHPDWGSHVSAVHELLSSQVKGTPTQSP